MIFRTSWMNWYELCVVINSLSVNYYYFEIIKSQYYKKKYFQWRDARFGMPLAVTNRIHHNGQKCAKFTVKQQVPFCEIEFNELIKKISSGSHWAREFFSLLKNGMQNLKCRWDCHWHKCVRVHGHDITILLQFGCTQYTLNWTVDSLVAHFSCVLCFRIKRQFTQLRIYAHKLL